jgi:hypothetical protein
MKSQKDIDIFFQKGDALQKAKSEGVSRETHKQRVKGFEQDS